MAAHENCPCPKTGARPRKLVIFTVTVTRGQTDAIRLGGARDGLIEPDHLGADRLPEARRGPVSSPKAR